MPTKIMGSRFLPIFLLVFILFTYGFSSSYDSSWNFDWSGIRPQVKDFVLALKNYGLISFGSRGNGKIETVQFNRQIWISKNAFDYELTNLLDYPDGTVKGLSYQALLRKKKKLKFQLLKRALNDSIAFVHFQMGCIGSSLMLNEYLSFFTFDEFHKEDYSHLRENLTEREFIELKTLFINRKRKEEHYQNLYKQTIR